jgi:general stress protein YciG
MSGTKAGAAKTKAKNLAKNPNYYRDIGKVGGKNSSGYEFAHGKIDPAIAGAVGGKISRRKPRNET